MIVPNGLLFEPDVPQEVRDERLIAAAHYLNQHSQRFVNGAWLQKMDVALRAKTRELDGGADDGWVVWFNFGEHNPANRPSGHVPRMRCSNREFHDAANRFQTNFSEGVIWHHTSGVCVRVRDEDLQSYMGGVTISVRSEKGAFCSLKVNSPASVAEIAQLLVEETVTPQPTERLVGWLDYAGRVHLDRAHNIKLIPDEVIEEVTDRHGFDRKGYFLAHPACPVKVVENYAHFGDAPVATNAVRHPNCSERMGCKTGLEYSKAFQVALERWPHLFTDDDLRFAATKWVGVQRFLAGRPDTPIDLLEEWAFAEDRDVRKQIASNPSVHPRFRTVATVT